MNDEAIDELVDRALRGEILDAILNEALFPGQRPPKLWRDWPPAAREVWAEAVRRYTDRVRRAKEKADGTPQVREIVRPSLAEAWAIVEASGAHPDPVSRYTWLDLSLRLSMLAGRAVPVVSTTAAQYQLSTRLGFRWRGMPPDRELVEAPCESCGRTRAVADLSDRRCDGCR